MSSNEYTQRRNKSSQKHQKEHYDRIGFLVRKGQKEVYEQAAADRGYSLASWIRFLMDKAIEEGS